MADTKLSGLSAKTTLADTDLLLLTDYATSPISSKSITYANLEARLRDATLVTDLGEVTVASGDHILIFDASASPQSLAKIVASDFATAAQANATHTGDVSGSTALTLQAQAISGQAEVTAASTDYLLILDVSDSPNALKKVLVSDLLDNATHTGDVTGSTALTVQTAAITGKGAVTAASGDLLLAVDVSASPQVLAQVTAGDIAALATPQGTAILSSDSSPLPASGYVLTADGVGGASWAAASGTGDLKADGTIPLTANWDVGSFKITAQQFESDIATGTAPLVVASTTVVTNLNADQVDGNDASAFATAAQGSTADAALPATGGTMTGNIAFASASPELTVDGRDVSADGAKLDGIEALADVTDATNVAAAGALMKTGGEMSGNITMAGAQTVDGRDLSADGTKLDGISAGADVTEDAVIAAGIVTAASGDYLAVQDVSASPQALKRALVSDLTLETIAIAASDETTDLTTGTSKAVFRMPYAFTLTGVRCSVTTAPAGSSIIVDINEKVGTPSPDVGTSILSTKLYIDAGEWSSETASASPEHQAVISDAALANDSEISIDIDQIGSGTAGAGLKVYLIGYRA